ncbi:MAG TPA: (2Fe-2S) ferredoxin domain-containing protein [Candidatus Polarisedimenticolia bacterium]|nr:(2Fe-2S) ferredoxin domain-containing protein [Candidatus Polarisedimenticolia bacterium]
MNLPYARHVLICVGPRCGGERGSGRIRQEFRKEFVRQQIDTTVKDTECLCFGLCTYGPNVIIYPEGVVYSGVKPADVAEIVRRHVARGQTVDRLLYKKKEAPPAPAAEDDDFDVFRDGDPVPPRG